MMDSEKLRAMADAMRSRATAPDIGHQVEAALALVERFEKLAWEAEQVEAAEIRRLFDHLV